MWLNIILLIAVLSIVTMVIAENRHPVRTLAWIVVLVCLPGIGLVLYFFFGRDNRGKRLISDEDLDRLKKMTAERHRGSIRTDLPAEDEDLMKLLWRTNRAYPLGGNAMRVYTDFDAMFTDLLAHLNEGKSARSPFNYMDKVAHSWAENHITTMEAAERYLTIYELEHHDVNQVMLHLGIKRMPSIEELKLYQKWTGEWGLSKEAILQACSQTVKTATPSFGYLDKIVEKLYNKGNSSEEEVKETLSEEAQQRAEASEVLKELGLKGITPELLEALSAFKAMGFDMDALLLAARETARKPVRSLEKYIQLLDELASQKLFDTESIKKYLKQSKKPSAQKKTSAHQFDERTKSDYDDVIIDL